MSKFKTSIRVDVEAVKRLLPPGAFVHGVQWDEKEQDVNLLWEHEGFTTGRDFPFEFPRLNLEKQYLPEGVRVVERRREEPVPAEPPISEPAPAPVALTEEELGKREFEAGAQLARSGQPVSACESDAARAGFAAALAGEGAPALTSQATAVAESPVVQTEPEVVATGTVKPVAKGKGRK